MKRKREKAETTAIEQPAGVRRSSFSPDRRIMCKYAYKLALKIYLLKHFELTLESFMSACYMCNM